MDGFEALVLEKYRLAGAGTTFSFEQGLTTCMERLRQIASTTRHPEGDPQDLNLAFQISNEGQGWIDALANHATRISAADGDMAKDSARRAAFADGQVQLALRFLDENAGSEQARMLRQARVLRGHLTLPHDGAAANKWLELVALHLYQGNELPDADRNALAVALHAWVTHGIGSRSALANDDARIDHELGGTTRFQKLRSEWIGIQDRARELFAKKHGIVEEAFEMSPEDIREAEGLWKDEYTAKGVGNTLKKRRQATRRFFDDRRDAFRTPPPPWEPLKGE